jgi:hypothetical protein
MKTTIERTDGLPFRERYPILWLLICIILWEFAIIGPIFFALGLFSFFVDFGDAMSMFGRPVRTTGQKVLWTIITFAIGWLGVWFASWHVRNQRSREV